MATIKKVLITRQGRKFYAKSLDEDLHTQYGFIRKEELKEAKEGSLLKSNINKKSKVLDAGSGSGALACFVAAIAKEVVTYEIRDDFMEIVRQNIEFLQLKNIKIKKKDIYNEIEDKGFDVVILDLPEPWKALESCSKALKPGGFIVSYSPSVPQVADFVNALRKNESFVYLKTAEIVEREWEVEERRVRPKSTGIGHSGFLSFGRKV